MDVAAPLNVAKLCSTENKEPSAETLNTVPTPAVIRSELRRHSR